MTSIPANRALALLLAVGCAPHAVRPQAVTDEAPPPNFPATIATKTSTRTFNSFFYFALDDRGRIWIKSIAGASKATESLAPEWQLFLGDGLPHDPGRKNFAAPKRIESINADQDELMAVSDEHRHYSVRWFENPVFKEDTPPRTWADRHGWPVAGPYVWDRRVAHNRGWAVGRRTRTFAFFEDPSGRTFDGGGGLSTYYFLSPDGTSIFFSDSGLPPDFSHTLCGPQRSTFIAESLQVAADTMFVINAYGEMRTRLADFDTVGSDTMFFGYTYDRKNARKDAIAIPSEDWFAHKPIPLEGQAQISTRIAIARTGMHNADRELRVAGYDQDRRPGYYAKRIFSQPAGSPVREDTDTWTFHADPDVLISPDTLLDPAETDPDRARSQSRPSLEVPRWKTVPKPPRRVPARNMAFRGELRVGGQVVQASIDVPDFHLDCSPATLRLSSGSSTDGIEVMLHTVEKWYHLSRVDPGHDGTPKEFLATLELTPAARETNDPSLRALVGALAPYDLLDFAFFAEGTEDYLQLESRGLGKHAPKVELRLVREGRAYPSFAAAREASLRHDSFFERASSPEYAIGKPLADLTEADLPALEARIAANEALATALTAAASAPEAQDKATPEWLNPDVLEALKIASGPELIRFLLPALPFRNVTAEEASYYAGNLTRSLPPLLRRSRELKETLLFYAQRDLQRALAIIHARLDDYRRRASELRAKGEAGHPAR